MHVNNHWWQWGNKSLLLSGFRHVSLLMAMCAYLLCRGLIVSIWCHDTIIWHHILNTANSHRSDFQHVSTSDSLYQLITQKRTQHFPASGERLRTLSWIQWKQLVSATWPEVDTCSFYQTTWIDKFVSTYLTAERGLFCKMCSFLECNPMDEFQKLSNTYCNMLSQLFKIH